MSGFPVQMMGSSIPFVPPVITAWEQMAPQLNGQASINCLAVFEDALFGGTEGGKLFQWDGVDEWVEVADFLTSAHSILSLAVFNDELYGTDAGGRLLEWNGTNAWVLMGTVIGGSPSNSSVVHGGSLYLAGGGTLQRWNGGASFTSVAAAPFSVSVMRGLISFSGTIFGTGNGGTDALYRWNGVSYGLVGDDTLITVAYGTAEHNAQLFLGSDGASGGRMWKWNGGFAIAAASALLASEAVFSLVSYKTLLLAGTGQGRLMQWDGATTLTEVAAALNAQTSINDMVEFQDRLYAGTANGGRLFRAVE